MDSKEAKGCGKEFKEKVKVLLLGHSFARRANDNCPLNMGEVVIHASGISGGSVDDLKRSWVEALQNISPDIVYIQCGENDIGLEPFFGIANKLMTFGRDLVKKGHLVVFGGLFKRYKCRYVTLESYELSRRQINRRLRAECRQANAVSSKLLHYCTSKTFYGENNFLPDGVHLRESSQYQWLRRIAAYCAKLGKSLPLCKKSAFLLKA